MYNAHSELHLHIVEKRCRRHSVIGSVSLCVPKTLWEPYLENQWREFHPILVTYVFGFVNVLIRFWRHKVKITAGNDPKKTGWIQYLRNPCREFHPILITNVFGFMCWLAFKIKGQGHSMQWPEKRGEYNIFVNIWPIFTKIRSRMYLSLWHWWGQRSRSQ